MQTVKKPITGEENQIDLSRPDKALVQFYYAFNHGDLETMSLNWLQSDEVAMDNPLGGIKRGWKEIKSVYEQIFNSSARVYVEYYDYTIHESPDIFYAVGRERGYFALGSKRIDLAIRTSRIFKLVDGIWKQVHHHGSIDDPKLLAHYQSVVLGNG